MFRGNLSTRPFYNERLVAVLIALGLLIGLGLTAFNVTAIYRLSAERTKQRSDQARVETDAAKTRASATAPGARRRATASARGRSRCSCCSAASSPSASASRSGR